MRTQSYDTMLEKSLSPLWKFTYYTGMLFDWCRPMPGPKYLIMKILRFMVIFIAFSFNVIELTMSSFELIEKISSNADVKVLAFLLTGFCWFLLGLTMYLTLLLRHKDLLAFFQDFKNVIAQINRRNSAITHKDGSKKYVALTYFLYLGVFLVMSTMSSLNLLKKFNSISIENFKEPIVTPMIVKLLRSLLIHVLNVWASLFTGLADIIPVFIYYYSALAIEVLDQHWQSLVKIALIEGKNKMSIQQRSVFNQRTASLLEREVRQISRLYDSIVHLVGRADHLFGHIIIFSQFLSLFVVCSFTPVLLIYFDNTSYRTVPYFLTLFAVRLVWPIFLSSKLYTSAGRLRASVQSFQSRVDLNYLSSSEEKAVNYLMNQLQGNQLSASPMGLYSITPSILLTILNTVVTYIIILLQAGGK